MTTIWGITLSTGEEKTIDIPVTYMISNLNIAVDVSCPDSFKANILLKAADEDDDGEYVYSTTNVVGFVSTKNAPNVNTTLKIFTGDKISLQSFNNKPGKVHFFGRLEPDTDLGDGPAGIPLDQEQLQNFTSAFMAANGQLEDDDDGEEDSAEVEEVKETLVSETRAAEKADAVEEEFTDEEEEEKEDIKELESEEEDGESEDMEELLQKQFKGRVVSQDDDEKNMKNGKLKKRKLDSKVVPSEKKEKLDESAFPDEATKEQKDMAKFLRGLTSKGETKQNLGHLVAKKYGKGFRKLNLGYPKLTDFMKAFKIEA
eukprot:maker-scaffold_15-snap-gene-7.42-mRNA-1 protein AED:0.05 eAED:0.05 QI:164/1/1/1/0.71/0.62/8/199/314